MSSCLNQNKKLEDLCEMTGGFSTGFSRCVAFFISAIIAIYNCKFGTDIKLVEENGKKFFLDSNTGKRLKL